MRGFGEDWSFGKRPWIKVSFPFQACRALRSELGKCQWSSPKFSGVGLAVWLPAQARDRAVHSALRFPAIRNCELHLFLPGSFCRGLTVALCGLCVACLAWGFSTVHFAHLSSFPFLALFTTSDRSVPYVLQAVSPVCALLLCICTVRSQRFNALLRIMASSNKVRCCTYVHDGASILAQGQARSRAHSLIVAVDAFSSVPAHT